MQISKLIIKIADKFSYKFPHIREYIRPLYHKIYLNRYYEKRREAFLSKSYDVIERFDKCLTEAGIQYSLGFGTMLGAIREKGIIGHDADMDTLIWADNGICREVKESLENGGFKRTRCFVINDGNLGREETYEYNSVPIDVFYIYPPINKLPYTAYYLPKDGYPTRSISMEKTGEVQAIRLDRPYIKEYIRVPFGHLNLPIMKNYDPILRACYGDSYMIPDPNFKRTNSEKWNDVHAEMIEGI